MNLIVFARQHCASQRGHNETKKKFLECTHTHGNQRKKGIVDVVNHMNHMIVCREVLRATTSGGLARAASRATPPPKHCNADVLGVENTVKRLLIPWH